MRPALAPVLLAILWLIGPVAEAAYAEVAPRAVGVDSVFAQEAQLFGHVDNAFPPEDTDNDQLGHSLSLSGDTLAVGAQFDDTAAGLAAGSVYVFVRAGTRWTEQQKLFAPDAGATDWFGFSVAISGDTLVASSPRAGLGQGAAYVFVRSGSAWTFQQRLSTGTIQGFGFSVAISGDTIVVGHPSAGFVYVFQRMGAEWLLRQMLVASDGAPGLGTSVSISGDTLVAGTLLARAAYVFVRNGPMWTEQQKLVSADAASDSFGGAVAVSGDTAVVGAYREDAPGGVQAGAAYVFERTGTLWSAPVSLLPSTRQAGAEYGFSVSVQGDTAAVGAHFETTAGGSHAGSAVVFTRVGAGWQEEDRLTASDAAADDEFGSSVATAGDTVAVGAPRDDTPGGDENSGSVYVFRPPIPAQFHTVPPCRVADTRPSGMPLVAGTTRTFTVGGACLLPPDARAVAVNLVAVSPGGIGFLTLYPAGISPPLASNINFAPGRTRANNAVVSLGTGGAINVRCEMVPGAGTTVHFVLDVYGYFK